MTIEELETKLINANVVPSVAKMIATMAIGAGIERHEKSWTIPASLVLGPSSIRRDLEALQRKEAIKVIMRSVIKEQTGAMGKQFMIVTDLAMARGNAYLSYRFSPEFIQWAGLPQSVAVKLH